MLSSPMSDSHKLSRLIRAHQFLEPSHILSEQLSHSLPHFRTELPYSSKPSLSDSWPSTLLSSHLNNNNITKRQNDDELQNLDWLMASPCLPRLPPLDDQDEPNQSSCWQSFNASVPSLATSMSGGGLDLGDSFPPNVKLENGLHPFSDAISPPGYHRTQGNHMNPFCSPMPGNYYHHYPFGTSGSSDRHSEKPALSYSNLIFLAILSSPRQAMTVNQMYQWCERTFPYYQDKTCGWKNSLRHNLSLNKGFQKLPKANGESGRGALWVIDPNQYQLMLDAVRKNPICLEILRQQHEQVHLMERHDQTHVSSGKCWNSASGMSSLEHLAFKNSAAGERGFSMANVAAVAAGGFLPNGWADIGAASGHLAWRVVPQNTGLVSLEHDETQEDADFVAMVERLHLTKEQIMAREKLTEEEMEGIPSIDEYPQLFKEMVTMKVEKKDGRKRRRKGTGSCVSFRAAPSLDHHYANHQMLLSPVANRMPCLSQRPHTDMEWFGAEPVESHMIMEEDDGPVVGSSSGASNSSLRDSSPEQRAVGGGDSVTITGKRRGRRSLLEIAEAKCAKLQTSVKPNSRSHLKTFSRASAEVAARILLNMAKLHSTCAEATEVTKTEVTGTSPQLPSPTEGEANENHVNTVVTNTDTSTGTTDLPSKFSSRSRRKAPICQRNVPPEQEETSLHDDESPTHFNNNPFTSTTLQHKSVPSRWKRTAAPHARGATFGEDGQPMDLRVKVEKDARVSSEKGSSPTSRLSPQSVEAPRRLVSLSEPRRMSPRERKSTGATTAMFLRQALTSPSSTLSKASLPTLPLPRKRLRLRE